MFKNKLSIFRRNYSVIQNVQNNSTEIEELKILVAKNLIQNNLSSTTNNLHDKEFKVFSQWGDDGIIQFLINKLQIPHHTFIEFGVQDYQESNTRFLLKNNNWKGLIIDGSQQYIDKIKQQDYYWQYDLKAKCSFVTAENINQLIKEENFDTEVGIYHIDIDGNDYWIWKATHVISPIIIIVEYQSLFGYERAITTPYKSDFVRSKAHYSHIYYGTSLLSLCDLAEEKGYYFIGCNTAGNNAYFVRKDKIGDLVPMGTKEGYVLSKFRESRDENGNLTYLSGEARVNLIKGLPVYNTRMNQLENV